MSVYSTFSSPKKNFGFDLFRMIRSRIRIFIIHKEANFDPEYTCVLDMCLLPKKGYSYVEAQSLYV